MKEADVAWMKLTLQDMHRVGIVEPRLRMLFCAAYYQNESIVRYLQELNHHTLTFRSSESKQRQLAHRYITMASLLAGQWDVLDEDITLIRDLHMKDFDFWQIRLFPEVIIRFSLKCLLTGFQGRGGSIDDLIAYLIADKAQLQRVELSVMALDPNRISKLATDKDINLDAFVRAVRKGIQLLLEFLQNPSNLEEIKLYAPQYMLAQNPLVQKLLNIMQESGFSSETPATATDLDGILDTMITLDRDKGATLTQKLKRSWNSFSVFS